MVSNFIFIIHTIYIKQLFCSLGLSSGVIFNNYFYNLNENQYCVSYNTTLICQGYT